MLTAILLKILHKMYKNHKITKERKVTLLLLQQKLLENKKAKRLSSFHHSKRLKKIRNKKKQKCSLYSKFLKQRLEY